MNEYRDHIRQTLDGQALDASEDLGMDAMRWTPAPASEDVTDEAVSTAAETAHALLDRATDAYLSLVNDVLGDGTHNIVVSARTPNGELTEGQQLTVMGDALILNEAASMRVCAVIAAGMVGCATAGLVVRTFGPNGSESVRGWTVRNFWLRPLTAQEIREAYTVGPVTGAPVAPEPGVEFRQAERVPGSGQAQTDGESASRTAPRDNRPPNRRS